MFKAAGTVRARDNDTLAVVLAVVQAVLEIKFTTQEGLREYDTLVCLVRAGLGWRACIGVLGTRPSGFHAINEYSDIKVNITVSVSWHNKQNRPDRESRGHPQSTKSVISCLL